MVSGREKHFMGVVPRKGVLSLVVFLFLQLAVFCVEPERTNAQPPPDLRYLSRHPFHLHF